MLMLELMAEAAKRYGSGPGWGAVVGDAGDQAEDGCGCCVPTLPQSLGGHLARILVMLDAGTDPRA